MKRPSNRQMSPSLTRFPEKAVAKEFQSGVKPPHSKCCRSIPGRLAVFSGIAATGELSGLKSRALRGGQG